MFDEFMFDVKEIVSFFEFGDEILEEFLRYQKKSLMIMLINFWVECLVSNWILLEYFINVIDYIFFDLDVIVREDEFSLLLVFVFNFEDYKIKFVEICQWWEMFNQ